MTSQILSFSYQDLDLTPRRDAVSETLQVAWSSSVPQHSILLRYRGHIIVTDRKSIGVLGEPGTVWAPLDLALKDVTASALGGPTLVDANGTAYLWDPPAAPRAIWHASDPGAYSAISLGDPRLLILRFVGGAMQDAYAIDAGDGRVLWRLDPGFHFAAAVPEGILAWTSSLDSLQCFDPDTGTKRWSVGRQGDIDLLGLVDGILWSSGHSQIHRLDCATGAVLPPVAVENAHVPNGIVDDRGLFHCCHGLNYQIYDLRDGGRRLSYVEFRITAAGPSLGGGRGGMIAATDGRMIFRDQRRGVWVVQPDRLAEPELIYRANSMIGQLAARQGQVLVGEDAGTITALSVRG